MTLLKTGHGMMARMSKTTMPKVGGGGGEEGLSLGWTAECVEGAGAIASKKYGLGEEILHRKTEWIKLDRTKVMHCELTNRYTIFNNAGNNENIIKIKGVRGGGEKDG